MMIPEGSNKPSLILGKLIQEFSQKIRDNKTKRSRSHWDAGPFMVFIAEFVRIRVRVCTNSRL